MEFPIVDLLKKLASTWFASAFLQGLFFTTQLMITMELIQHCNELIKSII